MAEAHLETSCLGLALDRSGTLRGVYPIGENPIERPRDLNTAEVVTLHELITTPPVINSQLQRLTKKQSYVLAVTLASSLLQLHTSPWLTFRLSKNDIFFLHAENTSSPIVDVQRPYVRQTYASCSDPQQG